MIYTYSVNSLIYAKKKNRFCLSNNCIFDYEPQQKYDFYIYSMAYMREITRFALLF